MYRLIAFVLIAAASVAQTKAQQQQAYGSVEGRVTNAQTGDSISGASLHLYPLVRRSQGKAPQTQAASSQADGSFGFEAVAPGTYFLSAEHPGFVATTLKAMPQAISVSAGQQVTNIAIQLNPQAVVSGKVLEENGDPVPGAHVEAFATYTTRGKTQLRRGASTAADKSGEYTLKNLAPGTYYLAAEPASEPAGASKEVQKKEPVAKTGSNPPPPELGPVRTFYPEALDLDGGTPLEITAGQNLTGVTIHLRRAATYHIRGKIDVAIASNPSRGWTLSLARRNSIGPDAAPRIEQPNADHTFDIGNVIAGSYTLTLTGIESGGSIQSGRMSFRSRLLARQDIDVVADDLSGVALSIIPPISLTGRVAQESSGTANLAQVRVNLSPAGAAAVGGFQSVAVNSDGTFAIEGLDPGEYMVHVAGIPAGMYVKSISFNRQDITTAGLDVLQGGSGEIDVDLRTGVGEVDGTVQPDETDQSATGTVPGQTAGNGGAMILLIPEVLALDGSGTLFGNAPATGSFTIRNVPPGRYYAFALERWSSVWQNADFLRAMQSAGTSVEIQEFGQIQVQLPLTTEDQAQQVASRLGLTAQ